MTAWKSAQNHPASVWKRNSISIRRATLSYETTPINSYEAEARRASRFNQQGHTLAQIDPHGPANPLVPDGTGILRTMEGRAPGQEIPKVIPKEEPTLDFPLTLDLRENQ